MCINMYIYAYTYTYTCTLRMVCKSVKDAAIDKCVGPLDENKQGLETKKARTLVTVNAVIIDGNGNYAYK